MFHEDEKQKEINFFSLFFDIILLTGFVAIPILFEQFPFYIRDNLLVLPISILAIIICCSQKDTISVILSSKGFVFLGNMGLELFLIHQILLQLTDPVLAGFPKIVKCLLQLFFTVIISYFVRKIYIWILQNINKR